MNWLLNLFKYKPKFKVGDILIQNHTPIESWEQEEEPRFLIIELGEHKYKMQWVNPKRMIGANHGSDSFRSIDNLYKKF